MNYFSSIPQNIHTAKENIMKQLEIPRARLRQLRTVNQSIIHGLVAIAIPILAVSLLIGVSYLGSAHSHSGDLSMTYPSQQASNSAVSNNSLQKSNIKIDIDGAVKDPGVKVLGIDARVDDALLAAGGYSDQADRVFLAQSLNLAQKLNDGDKIFIPSRAQVASVPANATYTTSMASSAPSIPLVSNKSASPTIIASQNSSTEKTSVKNNNASEVVTGPININTATLSQLESLPGIGPVYAQAIISGRPYTATTELCTKKIVKNSSTCQKIQSLITL